jgi:ribosomal protein L37AE/L43A
MKLSKKNIIRIFTFFLIIILIFIVLPVYARPGGGHSYSSGSSSGGGGFSGGGDGLGMLIYLLFSLLPPYISIPLVILIVILYGKSQKNSKNYAKQVISTPSFANIDSQIKSISRQIHDLKIIDPNFSRVLFLDFVSSLFTKFYAYKNNIKMLKTISPFLSEQIINSVSHQAQNSKINEIVIGSINIIQITTNDEYTDILLEINANYTSSIGNKSTRYIVTEKWLLERKNGVLSAEPEKMHKLSCPACGAPANFTDAGYCEHCGTLITPGHLQWYAKNRVVTHTEVIRTNSLLSYSPEIGTNYPTIFSPALEAEKNQFARIHNLDWSQYQNKFNKIVSSYFMQIYEKWASLKWSEVRHLLTDRLWESYNFWIEEYKRNGIRNALDDTKITDIHLSKIEVDKFYEAITVRIFASSKDYVVDKQGRILAGYSKSPRIFSEYWTFIRRRGVENDDYDMKTCPACGAPLDKIGQNGICEYCGAKITTGNFSWVVAIITQDEEYKG